MPKGVYECYVYLIGKSDIDGKLITDERLIRWTQDPDRTFVCIFCGTTPNNHNGFMSCPVCKDYKGIMPNLNQGEEYGG